MSRRNLAISAVSNFSTAYNLVIINIVHVIMEFQYCGGDACKAEVDAASTACLVGAICGQLTLGYVGDCLGRPLALQLTMAMSILGALASAFAVPLGEGPTVFTFLSVTRFVLGVGVGGVYPLAATISTESSAQAHRGRNASLVFSMQGVANLCAPLVGYALLLACGVPSTGGGASELGLAWRLALGLGALPGVLLLPFKTSAPHAAAAAASLEEPIAAADAPEKRPPLSLAQALRMRKYWGLLLGTAGGWFFFDITFYGNSLFQPTVLEKVFEVNASTPAGGEARAPLYGGLQTNRCLQMAVVGALGLPGYYCSVCLMDRLGRRAIQLQGFFFMALVFLLLGLLYPTLEQSLAGRLLMLLLYGLTFFFSNFGPNSTTFILPSETFPSNIRSTLNGFSAAMGKAGATLGSAAFKPMADALGLQLTMVVCAAVALCGLLITFFFVEDRRGTSMDDDDEPHSSSREWTPALT